MATDAEARSLARELLRRFVRDYATLNRLLRTQEHTDLDLDLAIDLTVADYNSTMPPIADVTIGTYPNLWLLIHGGAIHLLESAGLLQIRNELPYQSGGVTVRTFSHGPSYLQWIRQFKDEYRYKLKQLKVSQNIRGGWGGVSSPYSVIGWWTQF